MTSRWAGKKLPRHCHPHQFLLKSFGFSGAKTAMKRFLLWKIRFSAAKIAPCPPYTPLGTIGGSRELQFSRALLFFRQAVAPRKRGLLLVKKPFDKHVDGEEAPPPLPPSPVFAKILRISERKNCRETIFALENEIFCRKNRPVPTVHAAGHD